MIHERCAKLSEEMARPRGQLSARISITSNAIYTKPMMIEYYTKLRTELFRSIDHWLSIKEERRLQSEDTPILNHGTLSSSLDRMQRTRACHVIFRALRRDLAIQAQIDKDESPTAAIALSLACFFLDNARYGDHHGTHSLLRGITTQDMAAICRGLLRTYQSKYGPIEGYDYRHDLVDISENYSTELSVAENYGAQWLRRGKIRNLPGLRNAIIQEIVNELKGFPKYAFVHQTTVLLRKHFYSERLGYFESLAGDEDLFEGAVIYLANLALSIREEARPKVPQFHSLRAKAQLLLDTYTYKRRGLNADMYYENPLSYLERLAKHDRLLSYGQVSIHSALFLISSMFGASNPKILKDVVIAYALFIMDIGIKSTDQYNMRFQEVEFAKKVCGLSPKQIKAIEEHLSISSGLLETPTFGDCSRFLDHYATQLQPPESLLPHRLIPPINKIPFLVADGSGPSRVLRLLTSPISAGSFARTAYKKCLKKGSGYDFERAFKELLKTRDIKTHSGHYKPFNKPLAEADSVALYQNWVISFELKTNLFGYASHIGLPGYMLVDLARGFLAAQVQSLRLRATLAKEGSVNFYKNANDWSKSERPQGKIRWAKDRSRFYSFAVIPFPFEAMHNIMATGNFMDMFLRHSYEMNHFASKNLLKLQTELRYLSRELFGTDNGEEAFRGLAESCRLISFEEVYAYIQNSNSSDEFFQNLMSGSHVQWDNFRTATRIKKSIEMTQFKKQSGAAIKNL